MAKKTTKPTTNVSKPPKKGAMAQDPKDKPKGLTRVSPGVYRDTKGKLVTSGGKPLPGRGRREDEKKPKPKPTPTQTAPTTPAPPTPEELAEQSLRQGAGAYTNITNRFEEFDPYKMEQEYEMGFTQEMDRARQSVLSQFERRNAEQFGRERQSTQQAIAERGLDPNSPAAQAMVRDLNDREDRARQEAANAAEQAAYGVNAQAFGQAYKTALSPAEYFQAIQSPYVAGLQGQFASEQEKQRFEYEKQLNEQKFKQAQKLQKSGGGGQSQDGNAYANYVASMYGQPQQPQQSTGQAVATGITQGTTLGIVNRR
jgi:hypothetical protein